jgi:hypothetical protein
MQWRRAKDNRTKYLIAGFSSNNIRGCITINIINKFSIFPLLIIPLGLNKHLMV